jgi:S-methylmethionine-dependent homocysteine/selenocysteine methylase
MSSSKKDQTETSTSSAGSTKSAPTTTTTTNTATASSSSSFQHQQQQQAERLQESTKRMLDETKQNIQKSLEEARSQIPRYNQAIYNYQEQVLAATGEIATSYIDTQNAIIHAFNASIAPYFENIQNTYRQYYSINPQNVQEFYSQTISNIANNGVTVVRLVNNTIFTNFDLLKTSWQQATDNVKEISRVTSNTARAFEQSNKEVSSAAATTAANTAAALRPTNA